MNKPHPDDLLTYADRLFQDTRWLASAPSPAKSRRHLGARLFAGAPLVVELTAEALQAHPHLFPNGGAGPGLHLRQRRASAYLVMRNRLLYLAELANLGYLEEQSGAIETTLAILQQVQKDDSPESFDRQAALTLALCALALFQRPLGRPRKTPRKPRPQPAHEEATLDELMQAMFATLTGGR